MDYPQTYAVKRNFQLILRECSSRSLVDSLLDRMFSNEFLETDEYEILIRMQLGKEKLRTLISLMLDKHGSRYSNIYNVFIEGLQEDIQRPDIATEITDTYHNAPKHLSDNMSILSEDLRTSTTSLDYGRRVTFNYTNNFISCPAIPRLSTSPNAHSHRSTLPRKLSLDSSTLLSNALYRPPLSETESCEETCDVDMSSLSVSVEPNVVPDPYIYDVHRSSIADTYDDIYKVAVVGSRGVGKTSLVSRFSADRVIKVNERYVKVQIGDGELTTSFLNDVHCVVIVYDITNMGTLLDVVELYDNVNRLKTDDLSFVLVGNKTDVVTRSVSVDQGKKMASHLGIPLFTETSCTSNLNVDKLFSCLIKQIQDNISAQNTTLKPHKHERRNKKKRTRKVDPCLLM